MITKNDIVGEQEVFGSDLTLLMTADNEKLLCSVAIGEEVRCKDNIAKIDNLWDDVEIEAMIHLTVGERELILRGYQPVYTEKGIIVACELRKGIRVLTKDGSLDEVTRICEEGYRGRIYNVDLSMEEGKNLEKHVMYINGVAVGDYVMENHLEYMDL